MKKPPMCVSELFRAAARRLDREPASATMGCCYALRKAHPLTPDSVYFRAQQLLSWFRPTEDERAASYGYYTWWGLNFSDPRPSADGCKSAKRGRVLCLLFAAEVAEAVGD